MKTNISRNFLASGKTVLRCDFESTARSTSDTRRNNAAMSRSHKDRLAHDPRCIRAWLDIQDGLLWYCDANRARYAT